MSGRAKLHRPRVRATLVDRVEKPAALRMFARGIYDGATATVRSTGPQGSGILRSMSLANCLIDLPEQLAAGEPGTTVDVILTDLPEDDSAVWYVGLAYTDGIPSSPARAMLAPERTRKCTPESPPLDKPTGEELLAVAALQRLSLPLG